MSLLMFSLVVSAILTLVAVALSLATVMIS